METLDFYYSVTLPTVIYLLLCTFYEKFNRQKSVFLHGMSAYEGVMRSFGPEKNSQHTFYGGAIFLSSVQRMTSTFAVGRCLCGYLNLLIIS